MYDGLIAVGELTGAKMNLKKCHPPAQIMEILGFVYDAIAKSCKLSIEKHEEISTELITSCSLRMFEVKY